jgi:hypothetical protein
MRNRRGALRANLPRGSFLMSVFNTGADQHRAIQTAPFRQTPVLIIAAYPILRMQMCSGSFETSERKMKLHLHPEGKLKRFERFQQSVVLPALTDGWFSSDNRSKSRRYFHAGVVVLDVFQSAYRSSSWLRSGTY